MKLTFSQYLERRQIGDAEARDFLAASRPELLDAEGWGAISRNIRGEPIPYQQLAYRLHGDYARLISKRS